MHISVLLKETITGLNIQDDGIYVDCTLGYAGHSSSILEKITRGYLFAFDQDSDAIKASQEKLSKIANNFTIIDSNFKYIKEELAKRDVQKVNGILYDLGVSSKQLDEAKRGFSYHSDARLDMRMDKRNSLSAWEVVNKYSKEDLTKILYEYGEEKHASSIARKIVEKRKDKTIDSTLELVDVIKSSLPQKAMRDKHPARKTFQAIRIEVNDELGAIKTSLNEALTLLAPGGRIAVISFHSLEDRIVKNIFKEASMIDPLVKGLPEIPKEYQAKFRLINSKTITAGDKELDENHRSRSAKLRIIERI